jgi:hypothetical protein
MEAFLETKSLALPYVNKEKNQTIFDFFIQNEGWRIFKLI